MGAIKQDYKIADDHSVPYAAVSQRRTRFKKQNQRNPDDPQPHTLDPEGIARIAGAIEHAQIILEKRQKRLCQQNPEQIFFRDGNRLLAIAEHTEKGYAERIDQDRTCNREQYRGIAARPVGGRARSGF